MEQFKRKHNYNGLLVVIEGTDGSGKFLWMQSYKRDSCYLL